MILIGSYTQERVAESADALARLSNQLVELARGLPVLVGLGRAEAQVTSLRDVSEGYRRRTVDTLRVAFLSSLALELIATISVAVVAVFIGVRLVHGDMALETGLLALLLAPECYLPFREVGAAFHAAEDGIEAMERAERIASSPKATILLPERTEAIARSRPARTTLRVNDLRVQYADRARPAVEHLSFRAAPGEVIALSGPSGSGKSTALAAIAGLLGTTADGAVRVSGQVEGVAANGIAWVPQHPATLAETVGEEVQRYGHAEDFARGEVLALLARVGADHLIDRHPAELSPGELRRVALARALARIDAGATLLLLDEPTAHLDAATSGLVLDLIADLRGQVTILLVAHDSQVRALADRTVPVGGGTVPEAEMPDETAPTPHDRAHASRMPVIAERTEPDARGTLRDLMRIVQPWRGGFLLALLWGTIAALFAVALTSVSGWLIVRASQQPPILYLLVAIVGVRFFGIGRSIFRYLERLRLHDAIFAAMTDLRIATWTRLAAQGPSIARVLRGERAIDHLIGDIDRVRDLTPRVLMPPLVGAATAVVVTIALGILLPATVPLMLACSLASLVVAPFVALKADRAAGEGDVRLRSRTMRMLAGLFAAAPDLHANGADLRVLRDLDRLERQASAASRRTAWALGMGNALVILACTATSMAMLLLANGALRDGTITPQVAAVLVLTPLALVDPFIATCDAVQQWPALQLVLGRFRAQTDDAIPVAAPSSVPAAAPEGQALGTVSALSVEDLAARWPGMTEEVFAGLTASASRGRWLAVTGPSGSGKSTFLTVLQAFLRPSAGRYCLNTQDTAAMREETIRAHIAWCPQEAHLFDSSLRANLLLARSREDAPTEADLLAALAQVGLGDLLADLPDGLETVIGSQGSHLSGGQRQRVAIARTLLTRADVLLIDEPTAHLDRESANALMADLRAGLSDRVVVLVTHHAADLGLTDGHLRLG